MTADGIEPHPAGVDWPRYSAAPFPTCRFIPGNSPHPRRNPLGHLFGLPEPAPALCKPEEWAQSEDYRFGIDLYNFGYWWECHEIFEGFWHAAGRQTEQGQFFQALIQLAAGNLKRAMGNGTASHNLMQRCLHKLSNLPASYMGLDIASLRHRLNAHAPIEPIPRLLLRLTPADRLPR